MFDRRGNRFGDAPKMLYAEISRIPRCGPGAFIARQGRVQMLAADTVEDKSIQSGART